MNTVNISTPVNPATHFDGYQLNSMLGDFCDAVGCDEFELDTNGANGCVITSHSGDASIEAKDARKVSNKEYGYREWVWDSGDQSSEPELVALMNWLNGQWPMQ